MYKLNRLHALAMVALYPTITAYALDQPTYNSINQSLHSSDVQERAKASELLATSSPYSAGNDVLPLLVTALSDVDAKVRANGTAGLLIIATYTNPKAAPLAVGATDIRSYAPVQDALLKAIDDPDGIVRQQALATYLLSFPVSQDLQDRLVDKYDSEQRNRLNQLTIVSALTVDGNLSAKAAGLLNRLMESPEPSLQVAEALRVSSKPPQDVLPKLVDHLESAKKSSEKAVFARAIEKYGSQASQYSYRVASVANAETDANVKQEMQRVVRSISSVR